MEYRYAQRFGYFDLHVSAARCARQAQYSLGDDDPREADF
jgi:hypothetical protein